MMQGMEINLVKVQTIEAYVGPDLPTWQDIRERWLESTNSTITRNMTKGLWTINITDNQINGAEISQTIIDK